MRATQIEDKLTANYFPSPEDTQITHLSSFTNTFSKSQLQSIYPAHSFNADKDTIQKMDVITPDQTIDLDSNSSSPSIPESIRKLFNKDNAKDIFGIENNEYILNDNHVELLAHIMELSYDSLKRAIISITELSEVTIQRIIKTREYHFSTIAEFDTSFILSDDSSEIGCSLSPEPNRYFSSQRESQSLEEQI